MADEKKLLLSPNNVYHFFAHSVHDNDFFYTDDNKHYFLNQWKKYSEGMFRTYAYCLLSNHFHFCIQVEKEEKLIETITKLREERQEKRPRKTPYKPLEISDLPDIISQQIGHFLNSYTQSLNRLLGRKGTLMRENFGRLFVHDRSYLMELICYIHHNPIHHFGVENYSDWAYSSYNDYAFDFENDILQKENILSVFGGLEGFKIYHAEYKAKKQFLTIEDLVINYKY
jgi:putative transposase